MSSRGVITQLIALVLIFFNQFLIRDWGCMVYLISMINLYVYVLYNKIICMI